MSFAERNDSRQTLRPEAQNPPFRVGIQIWASRWQAHDLDTSVLEHRAKCFRVERVTIQDQVSRLFQEAIHTIGQPPGNLLHPDFTRLIGDTRDMDTTRTDVDDEVSGPGESHPRALSEPYVNVSAHTAPIIQPHYAALLEPQAPPACAVDRRPLLDDATPLLHPVSGTSRLLRVALPLCLASVLSSLRVLRLDFSLGIKTTGSHVPYKSLDHVHATFMPDADQAVDRYLLAQSRDIMSSRLRRHPNIVSTRHQWFTCVRLHDSHLTRSSRAFSHDAHHHGS
jgi:hypothetical protein